MASPLDLFFPGGGGGGDGGAGALLAFQRQRQKELLLESKEAREEARTVSSFRRRQLSGRTGFSGLVGVGEAVRPTQQRLANRIAGLSQDDPERTSFTEAVAERRAERTKSRRIITGEEFDVRGRISEIEKDFDKKSGAGGLSKISLADAQKIQKQLEDLQTERGGRHAEREEISELLAKVRKRTDRGQRAEAEEEDAQRRERVRRERERREREQQIEGGL